MQIKKLMVIAGTTLGFAATALAADVQQIANNNELVADAAARSSLQGGGSYGAMGFNIADARGENRLTLGGAVQFRYNASFRDSDSVGDQADTTLGFTNSLTRLRASGVIAQNLGYKVQATFSEFDGVAAIDDAFGTYDFNNGWMLKFGQFNLPVVREIMVGAEDHLGSDFSMTSLFFGQGYSQGVQIGYTDAQWRGMLAFSDGAGTANTTFDDGAEADYALSGRVEFLAIGSDWNRFNNYTSWRNADGDGLLIGAAVHFQDGGETNNTDDTQILLYTIDASWEGPGYNVTGAFYGSNVDDGTNDEDNFGAMIQGGYFFNDQFEAFARWDAFFLDSDSFADDQANFGFLGANYYVIPESNAAKFTAQLGYAFDATNGLFASGLSGSNANAFLGDSEEGEIALQFQFQLIF